MKTMETYCVINSETRTTHGSGLTATEAVSLQRKLEEKQFPTRYDIVPASEFEAYIWRKRREDEMRRETAEAVARTYIRWGEHYIPPMPETETETETETESAPESAHGIIDAIINLLLKLKQML